MIGAAKTLLSAKVLGWLDVPFAFPAAKYTRSWDAGRTTGSAFASTVKQLNETRRSVNIAAHAAEHASNLDHVLGTASKNRG